jgi:hypothetical protein
MQEGGRVSASPFRRKGSPFWYVRRDIMGVGNVTISTRTTSEARARQYDQLVLDLRDLGRLDAIRALKAGTVTLAELYASRSRARLDALLSRAESPLVRPLVADWLVTGAIDCGIRTISMRRYKASWEHLLEVLSRKAPA